MKVKPISRSIKATALTNPNPSFVSQVKAGANQKPWRAVKMDAAVPADDNSEDSMKIKTAQKAAGNAVVAAVAPKGYGVMQFEFAKSEFADVDAVKAWMDAGGYEDYEVAETKNGFEVVDADARFIAGSVSKIDGFHKGVAAFVGKLTDPSLGEDEQPAADPVETAKAATDAIAAAANPAVDPAPRTRAEGGESDDAGAAGEAPAGEAKEGEEAPAAAPAAGEIETSDTAADLTDPKEPVPGVIPDEQPAVEAEPDGVVQPGAQTDAEKAAEIVVRADAALREKGVYEATRLGEIVNSLGWIVYDADYTGLSDETVAKIKDAANALLEAFMQAAQDAANELTEVFRSVEERAARAAPAADAPANETPTDIAAIVAAAVAKAVAPIEDRARAAEAAATEASERAVTAERSLSERVEADNARGQTRKGAEDPLVPESTGKAAKERSVAGTTILRSFGSRHA